MSVRLYVGNLPKEQIDREKLQALFADAGSAVTTKLIKDRKTGKCRGFAFVTVPTDESADQFIEKYNGQSFMDSPLKIEKALPRTPGSPEGAPEGATESAPAPAPKARKEREKPANQGNEEGGSKSASKKSKKQRNRRGSSQSTPVSYNDDSTFQPDPRWATELTKLKELLSAQVAG